MIAETTKREQIRELSASIASKHWADVERLLSLGLGWYLILAWMAFRGYVWDALVIFALRVFLVFLAKTLFVNSLLRKSDKMVTERGIR